MRTHPSWYYRRYEQVFGRGASYDREIEAVMAIAPLAGRVIQEIGAGTGEHAERIMAHRPATLELVDDDATAIGILQRRFGNAERVRIVAGDGFRQSWGATQFDVVIAMYSVALQGASSLDALRSRVAAMQGRLRRGGVAVFECIDRAVSERVYPLGAKSVVYEEGEEAVHIMSVYEERSLIVKYEGTLSGEAIDYIVPMLSITRQEVEELVRSAASVDRSEYGVRPLDAEGRRLLAYVGHGGV